MKNSNIQKVEVFFNKNFEELFIENERYILITINRFYSKYKNTIWYEDIVQCGRIGLAEAIETLDITRSESFINHIITNIRKNILYFENTMFGAKGFSKRNATERGIESLNKTIGETKNEIINTIAINENLEETALTKIDLQNSINKLLDEERLLINKLLSGKTQKTIAKEMGIAEATITQRLKKIYKKMRKDLKDI